MAVRPSGCLRACRGRRCAYLTGWKGFLLRSGCDCSTVTWWLGDSNWRGRKDTLRPPAGGCMQLPESILKGRRTSACVKVMLIMMIG